MVSLLLVLALPLSAAVFDSTSVAPATAPQQITVDHFIQTKIRDMDDLLGKDFNWKEKVALRIVRKKLRMAVKKNPSLATHSFAPTASVHESVIYTPQPDAEGAKYSTLSMLSFGSALLSGLLMFVSFGWGVLLLLLSAMVTGALALMQIRRQPEQYRGRGFAWFGIVFGGLGLILIIAAVLLFVALFAQF